jgi:hypothetical protein
MNNYETAHIIPTTPLRVGTAWTCTIEVGVSNLQVFYPCYGSLQKRRST